MAYWSLIDWITFCIAIIWTAMNHNNLIQYYKVNDRCEVVPNSIALVQLIGIISDVVFQYSPGVLILVILLAYVIPFFVMRVPILSNVACIYGYPIIWLARMTTKRRGNDFSMKNTNDIKEALRKRVQSNSNTSKFQIYLLDNFSRSDNKELYEAGYMLRRAEEDVIGYKKPIISDGVSEILKQGTQPQEKIITIAEYLDSHGHVGLGEPIRPYLLAPMEKIAEVFDAIVRAFLSGIGIDEDDYDLQFELKARAIAFGYVYRVAEELVTYGS